MATESFPVEIFTHILQFETGDDGILFLWNTCRYVSWTWKAIVERIFEEELLPDTEIFLVPTSDLKEKLQPDDCLQLWRESHDERACATAIGFSFAYAFEDESRKLAIFSIDPVHPLLSVASYTALESTTTYAAVVIRIRRFASDVGIPRCLLVWGEDPCLSFNWRNLFSTILSEEALVVKTIEAKRTSSAGTFWDVGLYWDIAYKGIITDERYADRRKPLPEVVHDALREITEQRRKAHESATRARARPDRTLTDEEISLEGCNARVGNRATQDCRYDALFIPYSDDDKHIAATRRAVEDNQHTHDYIDDEWQYELGWRYFEFERVSLMWLNQALEEKAREKRNTIKALRRTLRQYEGDAAEAEMKLADLRHNIQATKEELSRLGDGGSASEGSVQGSEQEEED
ncbi:hypothetical protein MMC18_004934 [Xylographa bjoerkii]|nr:hypothetical protein [Xylographa bjoerkii]